MKANPCISFLVLGGLGFGFFKQLCRGKTSIKQKTAIEISGLSESWESKQQQINSFISSHFPSTASSRLIY